MARQVIKTLFSSSNRIRVEIVLKQPGLFTVEAAKWTEEIVEGYGKVAEFWEPVSHGATYTDTIERAEQLAREALQLHTGGVG